MHFCIEILGESAFHKFLIQSGWSGRDYIFQYNRSTNSHMRAYRRIEDYYAERVDMHKAANIWPLLGNLLPAERIEPHIFTQAVEIAPSGVPDEECRKPSTQATGLAAGQRKPLDACVVRGVSSRLTGEFPNSKATPLH